MKLITFAVPCYNSAAYMNKCIDSILVGGDDVEIIIVDDGSTDATAAIADSYAKRFPSIVRAVHKENGGHGSGVNRGLAEATGLYYKVVDSDDWLDEAALKELLETIRTHVALGTAADLYITNFVYEHADGNNYVSDYIKKMPVRRFFGWEKLKPLRLWKMLLMHSLVYSTEKLRRSDTVLPEKTFYVDNLFAYKPLPYMNTLYYLNVDLYRYFIGRADQSVNVENMLNRYDQQILVMEKMLEAYTFGELDKMCRPLRKLMFHCLEVIMLNTSFFTTAKDSPLRRRRFRDMWAKLKRRDVRLYNKLKYRTLVRLITGLPWRVKGKVTTISYKFLCKHVKLGA